MRCVSEDLAEGAPSSPVFEKQADTEKIICTGGRNVCHRGSYHENENVRVNADKKNHSICLTTPIQSLTITLSSGKAISL